jgi:uncharacterized membrane protein YgcG
MKLPRLAFVVALLAAAAAPTLPAQERTLHWSGVAVDARLDSAGRLHVKERQAMVFTGEWNGGERQFNVRLGQDFRFERLLRVDSLTGAEIPLVEGDVDQVDHFDWFENRTLRWRARSPADPPFQSTPITYVLEYSLSNILVPQGGGQGNRYLLDHDFAFSDRVGDIEAFTLDLSIDPAWAPEGEFAGAYGPVRLAPGEGYVLMVPLAYRGVGRPGGVEFGADPSVRYALVAVLVGGVAVLLVAFVRREASLGRFDPPVPDTTVDERWLGENVFNVLPEVVGASWDNSTSSPEVAAVLARLVSEGKMSSEVKTTKVLFISRDVLSLRLLVSRDTLRGYERSLVDSLFDPGSDWTDTDQVRQRYKSTGFDPASVIRKSVERLAGVDDKGAKDRAPVPSKLPTLLLFLGGLALVVAAMATRGSDVPLALAGLGIGVVGYIIAASQAHPWRSRVVRLEGNALRFLVPLAALVGALLVVLVRGPMRAGAFVLAGLTLLCLAIVNSVLNAAKSRQGARMIAERRNLAAARDYFRRQLKQPQPALQDAWFPYLIAFGLGSHMDRWFRAFGGERRSRNGSFTTVSHGSSRSSGPSWTGFGGGGGFSGGGSSGSWTSAVSGIAAGVSAPSKSSSGGGSSSSSSSSGGGGGGGW